MDNLEQYNRTGMRDAYNVLKYLEKDKHKPNDRKKGGKPMHANGEDPTPSPEQEAEEKKDTAADAEAAQESKDLAEKDEDGDNAE